MELSTTELRAMSQVLRVPIGALPRIELGAAGAGKLIVPELVAPAEKTLWTPPGSNTGGILRSHSGLVIPDVLKGEELTRPLANPRYR